MAASQREAVWDAWSLKKKKKKKKRKKKRKKRGIWGVGREGSERRECVQCHKQLRAAPNPSICQAPGSLPHIHLHRLQGCLALGGSHEVPARIPPPVRPPPTTQPCGLTGRVTHSHLASASAQGTRGYATTSLSGCKGWTTGLSVRPRTQHTAGARGRAPDEFHQPWRSAQPGPGSSPGPALQGARPLSTQTRARP